MSLLLALEAKIYKIPYIIGNENGKKRVKIMAYINGCSEHIFLDQKV